MKVVLLCGGMGTRLREETQYIPKPMVPIGGIPLVVHIMNWYLRYGHDHFILAAGYKQEIIKNYFAHRNLYESDVTIRGTITNYWQQPDAWATTIVNTGETTLKGGRLFRIRNYLDGSGTFMCTYGDSLSNVNINELLAFHKSHGKLVTITGVHQPARFGEVHHKDGLVYSFTEKPNDGHLINGGYMVMDYGIFNYLDEDCDLEVGPLEKIAEEGQMMTYHHKGYWSCIDTIVDMNKMNDLWKSGRAPWR